jgi:hypothetical protein
MADYISLSLPPGVYRQGTDLQGAGRFRDASLIRWTEGTLQNMRGWRQRTQPADVGDVEGKARAMLAWRDNTGTVRAAIGTNEGLYVISTTGTITDITPTGFTAGSPDATFGGGYGAGPYGEESYGTPRLNSAVTQPASMWSLDTFGENLIGVMQDDGDLYEWELDPLDPAEPILNAPSARAVVVTDERIVFALGAGGNPRSVAWSDQEDNTNWTPSATSYAGDIDLQTNGRIVGGRRVRGGALIWTDTDVHLARFLGLPFVYGFERLGSGCGMVSANACIIVDNRAFWMNQRGFFAYDGAVQELPCDVSDFVFSNINVGQISKTTAMHQSQFGEVWWFYPSTNSNECDRYVIYNYKERHWNIGTINRLAGYDAGEFLYPLMIDEDGIVYDHEVGFDYDDQPVFAETGPFLLGNGDRVMKCTRYVPDERTTGQVETTFTLLDFQGSTPRTVGPFGSSQPTPVRFTGRQITVRYDGVAASSWRVGAPRLAVTMGGKR